MPGLIDGLVRAFGLLAIAVFDLAGSQPMLRLTPGVSRR